MKISNVLILLAAVYIGLFVVPQWIFVRPKLKSEQTYFLTPEREAQIRQLLIDELENYNSACVYEGPFPFDPRETHHGCQRCEDLEKAGLVTKTVEEYEEHGELKFSARYDLTDLGMTLYSDPEDPPGRRGPRLCFGTPVLHHIDSIRYGKLINNPGAPAFAVHYVIELKDPPLALFDPRMQVLKLPLPPLPERGKPVMWPANVTTVFSYGQMSVAE